MSTINNINNFFDWNFTNICNWGNLSPDINDVHNINYILLLFTAMFTYCGYKESITNYRELCKPTIGKIIDVSIEEYSNASLADITMGIKNYAHVELYRIKITYEYTIKGKLKYTGYFYNNNQHKRFEVLNKIKKYWAHYKKNPYIKAYYLKSNPATSNTKLQNIKDNNINFYYNWGLMFFILLMIFLIFLTFCIINNKSIEQI